MWHNTKNYPFLPPNREDNGQVKEPILNYSIKNFEFEKNKFFVSNQGF